MNKWRPIDSIPDRIVEVKTVTGIVCLAKRQGTVRCIKRANRYGPRRCACFRRDKPCGGDVMAVKWREPKSKKPAKGT